MHTQNQITIQAPVTRVFAAAASVERWPELLPHYRWVRVEPWHQGVRRAEMCARWGAFPVRWTAEQSLDPEGHRIRFRHVRGPSRGMEVEWQLTPTAEGTDVRIVHDLSLSWPLIGQFYADEIVGRMFVSRIAGRTLRCLKAHLEGPALQPRSGPATGG